MCCLAATSLAVVITDFNSGTAADRRFKVQPCKTAATSYQGNLANCNATATSEKVIFTTHSYILMLAIQRATSRHLTHMYNSLTPKHHTRQQGLSHMQQLHRQYRPHVADSRQPSIAGQAQCCDCEHHVEQIGGRHALHDGALQGKRGHLRAHIHLHRHQAAAPEEQQVICLKGKRRGDMRFSHQ